MNLRNNKGFATIDIAASLIIIMIFIPLIFGIVNSIDENRNEVERKSKAIDIATNILEIAKSTNYNQVKIDGSNPTVFMTRLNNNGYIYDNSRNHFTTVADDVSYRISISISTSDKDAYVKTILVIVEYPIKNITKKINISTLLQNS